MNAPAEPNKAQTAGCSQTASTQHLLTRVSPQTWIVLLVMAVLWFLLGSRLTPNDFLNLYTGGTLALRGPIHQMYVPEVQLHTERRFAPA